MPRARKPIPLRLIEGNYRKDRHPKNPLTIRTALGDPPAYIAADPVARGHWYRVKNELEPAGVVCALDNTSLAMLCTLFSRWVTAERALAKVAARDKVSAGLLARTKNDNVIQSPLVGIANRAMLMYMRLCREFGMTPAARSGVEFDQPDPDDGRPRGEFF